MCRVTEKREGLFIRTFFLSGVNDTHSFLPKSFLTSQCQYQGDDNLHLTLPQSPILGCCRFLKKQPMIHMLEVIKIITQIRKLLFLPWQSISKYTAQQQAQRFFFLDTIPLSGGLVRKVHELFILPKTS